MANVKALVVGVSNYNIEGAEDLPFCKNDILAMETALHKGLKISRNDIITCGSLGVVDKEDFINEISNLSKITDRNHIAIFYFSGHGTTKEDKHYLVFSDGMMHTQEIIEIMHSIKAKSKIIILDCCFSGNFNVSGTSDFNISETVEEFNGRGYAVFSSSTSTQESFGHPEKPISLFTNFICNALQTKFLIKKGLVSLYDIHKTVSLYLETWNRKNSDILQKPIFKANMGGTIYFEVEEYIPYNTVKIYQEHEKYIIYNVDPVHTGLAKRYSAQIILKEPLSIHEISEISLDIIDIVKNVDVYQNKIPEKRWKGQLANIVWLYFGIDESDIVNSNYICHTTWVDDSQDKDEWYKINNKDEFIMNGIHFKIHSYYESLRTFNEKHTLDEEEQILKTREILRKMINLAQKAIDNFNEYKNWEIREQDFIEIMNDLSPKIDKYYLLSTNLDIAPDEIHDWDQACASIFGTIHDFTLFYNKNGIEKRTTKNRIICMEMTIKRYFSDLRKIIEEEKRIF
jgi:hypothetical protein